MIFGKMHFRFFVLTIDRTDILDRQNIGPVISIDKSAEYDICV